MWSGVPPAGAMEKGTTLHQLTRAGAARRTPAPVSLCVPPPDDEERDRDQGGGEHHEDSGLDELERPEPVARLIGRERAVTEARQARECGAYLAFSLLA